MKADGWSHARLYELHQVYEARSSSHHREGEGTRGMLFITVDQRFPPKPQRSWGGLGIQVAELKLIYRKDGRLPPHPLRARWQTLLFSNEVPRLYPYTLPFLRLRFLYKIAVGGTPSSKSTSQMDVRCGMDKVSGLFLMHQLHTSPHLVVRTLVGPCQRRRSS